MYGTLPWPQRCLRVETDAKNAPTRSAPPWYPRR